MSAFSSKAAVKEAPFRLSLDVCFQALLRIGGHLRIGCGSGVEVSDDEEEGI